MMWSFRTPTAAASSPPRALPSSSSTCAGDMTTPTASTRPSTTGRLPSFFGKCRPARSRNRRSRRLSGGPLFDERVRVMVRDEVQLDAMFEECLVQHRCAIRVPAAAGRTDEFTSQFYFTDELTDRVHAREPCSAKQGSAFAELALANDLRDGGCTPDPSPRLRRRGVRAATYRIGHATGGVRTAVFSEARFRTLTVTVTNERHLPDQ